MDAETMRAVPLFAALTDDELYAIAPFAEEVAVPAGRVLVRERDYSYDFFAILDGEAEVRHGDEVVARLGVGEVFGEMGVLERNLRSASVVAVTDMRLVTLTHWELKRMRKVMPQAVEEMQRIMEARCAHAS